MSHIVIPTPIGPVNGSPGGVVNYGAETAMKGFSEWVANGAVSILDQVGKAMNATTAPDLGAGWFTDHYALMAGLAALVILPMALASIMGAIVRQDAGVLVRCLLVNLPLALLLSAVAVEIVRLALAAVDAMCSAVSSGSGGDMSHLFVVMEQWLSSPLSAATGETVPSFVLFLIAILVAFGALVVWLEMVVRSACVYVAVLFLPLGFAGLVLPSTIPWCRRLVETIAALILSKLVIVATLSLAVSALGSPTGSVADIVEGTAMLLLAAFAPFALLRLIPVVEAGAAGHLQGLSRRALSAIPVAQARSGIRTVLAAGAAGAGGGAGMVGVVRGAGEGSAGSGSTRLGGGSRSSGTLRVREAGAGEVLERARSHSSQSVRDERGSTRPGETPETLVGYYGIPFHSGSDGDVKDASAIGVTGSGR